MKKNKIDCKLELFYFKKKKNLVFNLDPIDVSGD